MAADRLLALASLRWSVKSWGRLWLGPALPVLLLVAFFATGYAAIDRPAVWAMVVVFLAFAVVNLCTIRRISVDENGVLELTAPLRHIAVRAEDVKYLAPAFDRDSLELGYGDDHCKILDDFDDLAGIEAAIARFNSSFRGRDERDA